VEIQALTVPAKGTMSRVFSDKIDSARVSRIAAILEKHLGLRLSDQDLYVNVAGGIRITEVGVELALAGALYSARTGLSLPRGTAIAGELSLTGEIRPVRRLAGRIKTSRGLGFENFLAPLPDAREQTGETPERLKDAAALSCSKDGDTTGYTTSCITSCTTARHIKSAIQALFSGGGTPSGKESVSGG
jgi:predicted ATP-dependent serine protease